MSQLYKLWAKEIDASKVIINRWLQIAKIVEKRKLIRYTEKDKEIRVKNKRKEVEKMMNLVTLEAVHTHTQVICA